MILLAIEKHTNITLRIKVKADYQLYLSCNLISSVSFYFCFYKQNVPPTRYLGLPNV